MRAGNTAQDRADAVASLPSPANQTPASRAPRHRRFAPNGEPTSPCSVSQKLRPPSEAGVALQPVRHRVLATSTTRPEAYGLGSLGRRRLPLQSARSPHPEGLRQSTAAQGKRVASTSAGQSGAASMERDGQEVPLPVDQTVSADCSSGSLELALLILAGSVCEDELRNRRREPQQLAP
jgi:hypothetical protein